MPDNAPQSNAHHTRLDPPFHFFALPVLGITVLYSIWNLIRNFSIDTAWMVVVSLALMVVAVKARTNALRVQDRIIRLEERLRLASLLPEPLRSRIGQLSEAQLIAIRFASDAEVPGLAEKTLSGNLAPADIKQAIVTWRPDNLRV